MSANYYEHQSTYSPNMPLRNLLYYTEDVRRWIRKGEKNIYRRSTIPVPTPHFVVFYKSGVLLHALIGYTFLIELVRKYSQDMGLEEAIYTAIDECIDSDILAEFLRAHRNEVEKLMNLDFTHERLLELTARDEFNAGFQQGVEQERKNSEKKRLKDAARIKELEDILAANNISMPTERT